MPGKLGTSAASSLLGCKQVKKGTKKLKMKKLKKKKTPESKTTSSDQPDGGHGAVSGSGDGNVSDDEREDEEDDEKDQKHREEEYSEEDEEVVETDDEIGKIRDDVSHEADIEDFFEENSVNNEVLYH